MNLLLAELDHVDARRSPPARPIGDSPCRRDDGPPLGVLDVVNGLLMVVATEYQAHVQVRERPEYARGVPQPVTLRELPLHRVVMHDDHAPVVSR